MQSRTRDPESRTEATQAAPARPDRAEARPRKRTPFPRLHLASLVTLLVIVAFTIGLFLVTASLHNSNENRLLKQRAREAGVTVTAAVSGLQTPLSSAAQVAQATNGNVDQFRRVAASVVGTGRSFVSLALWRMDDPTGPIAVTGIAPELASRPAGEVQALFAKAARSGKLTVAGLVDQPAPRLAYLVTSQPAQTFVVSAETALPKNRTSVVRKDQAFSDLENAIYLGPTARPENLLTATTPHLPLRGRTTAVTVPFGDSALTLVFKPTGQLGGALLARLPWIVLGAGLALAIVAALTAERLVRRRSEALALANDNARLYATQRGVAETLQHSLLPDTLPDVSGLTFAVRYLPGVAGVEIGGDWYDVIPQGDRVVVVVGDVSGRGVPAGIVMASLRYAIRAYAAQGDDPATILTKLGALVDVGEDGCFATVVCGAIDVARHEITIANAGHLRPLLLDGDEATFVSTPVGVPVGVDLVRPYETVTIRAREGATLLAFTDGLVERRGQTIDVGLERLEQTARRAHGSLEDLLTTVLRELSDGVGDDDTAVLGVRWTA
ncbi:MAG TPA: PP2C family protein-serine/threonine phosphatase [Acidimicrobiia bacterium]|jgi:serine phosphatase RsbU (regulator of sigma subunit)